MAKGQAGSKITELYGVYDADGTLLGEATYWIGARLGLRHCSLCDITHSLFTEKSEWQRCVSELSQNHGVSFKTYHRNDQPDEVRQVIAGEYPAIVARDSAGKYSLFMGATLINQCSKSPQEFLRLIISTIG
jgi:hypothetical protein